MRVRLQTHFSKEANSHIWNLQIMRNYCVLLSKCPFLLLFWFKFGNYERLIAFMATILVSQYQAVCHVTLGPLLH